MSHPILPTFTAQWQIKPPLGDPTTGEVEVTATNIEGARTLARAIIWQRNRPKYQLHQVSIINITAK